VNISLRTCVILGTPHNLPCQIFLIVHSFVRSFVGSFVRSFVCSFVRSLKSLLAVAHSLDPAFLQPLRLKMRTVFAHLLCNKSASSRLHHDGKRSPSHSQGQWHSQMPRSAIVLAGRLGNGWLGGIRLTAIARILYAVLPCATFAKKKSASQAAFLHWSHVTIVLGAHHCIVKRRRGRRWRGGWR
jgi:hypothetical protein